MASTQSSGTADYNAENYIPPMAREVDAKTPLSVPEVTPSVFNSNSGTGQAGSLPAGHTIPIENEGGDMGDIAVPADNNLCRTQNPYGIPRG